MTPSPAPSRRSRAPGRASRRLGLGVLALVAGVLWGLPFGRQTLPVASWVALVPFLLVIVAAAAPARADGRPRLGAAFLFGWLGGTASWLTAIPWIVPTMAVYGALPGWLAVLCLLALSLFLGLYLGLFAALAAPLLRLRGALGTTVALLAVPGLWVVTEWLRGWIFSGFPWNLAGSAWTDVPGALPLGAWIGVWGVSFLVVFANLGVTRTVLALVERRRAAPAAGTSWLGIATPALVGILVPLLLLAVAGRWAVPWAVSDPERRGAGPGSRVAIVQPNIENQAPGGFDGAAALEGYGRLLELSRRACGSGGTLLVWPESAAWPQRWGVDARLERDVRALAEAGCPVLINSPTFEASDAGSGLAGRWLNSVYLVDGGDGEAVRYDKRHLVPFGEYVPLADVFSFLGPLARNAGSFSPADRVVLLPWRGHDLGLAICFEVVFPAEVTELTRAGATALVTVTNDAWYGDTAAPWQHFRAARWRAAENRRPLVRSAITGVSALVGPDGSVESLLGVGEEGILVGRLWGRTDLSPFARRPWLVLLVSGLLAAAGLAFAILFIPRRGSTGPPERPTHSARDLQETAS